jgi:hypothetical protein
VAVFDTRNFAQGMDRARIAAGFPSPTDARPASGARNLRQAWVAESVIMKIAGWKASEMFRRYGIVSTQELDYAMSKLEASNAGLTEVSGSSQRKKNSKSFSINHAEVAQLVEQTIRNRQVAGSIPALGSISFQINTRFR